MSNDLDITECRGANCCLNYTIDELQEEIKQLKADLEASRAVSVALQVMVKNLQEEKADLQSRLYETIKSQLPDDIESVKCVETQSDVDPKKWSEMSKQAGATPVEFKE